MMKFKLLLMFILFNPFACFSENNKVITFGWGGRLGDNILDYTHAKWLSYKYGIPLLLTTFEYSDQFVFYDKEEHLTPEKCALYTEVRFESPNQLVQEVNTNTRFFLAHGCDSFDEYVSLGYWGTYVPVDWNDEYFKNMMKGLIYPKNPLNLIIPPKGVVSVALHYRNGGGFIHDTDTMKRALPLRFPENEFYLEQLKRLYLMVGCQPLYVYIFTDSPEPEQVKTMFQSYLAGLNIKFVCREAGNRHDLNVLEDMFSMMNFDCLIRPISHYSITASHLGDFKIELFPKHGYWYGDKFVVDEVNTVQKATWDSLRSIWNPM
jgi:hypothetical protein